LPIPSPDIALQIMSSDPVHHATRREHHFRLRQLKRFLRFMPRRAVFHKYPLIGRFAAIARKRSYLWSFKSPEVRPALYAGTVLSLMPLLGVQLPLSFGLALLLRCNFMLLGGLQFVTNVFTAAPIYGVTYWVGKSVIEASGFGAGLNVVTAPAHPLLPKPQPLSSAVADPFANGSHPAADDGHGLPHEIRFSKRVGSAINALVIGGVIVGAASAGFLDLCWLFGMRRAAAHRAKVESIRLHAIAEVRSRNRHPGGPHAVGGRAPPRAHAPPKVPPV
jgi:uncharacterized protein (DUF2062 family)